MMCGEFTMMDSPSREAATDQNHTPGRFNDSTKQTTLMNYAITYNK
jgi:hypothetical protein